MTWLGSVRAAWRRHVDRLVNADRLIQLSNSQPMPRWEDTGSIVATPEDLAEIGPSDPVTRPGRRYPGPPRHAKPKGKVPAVTFQYGDKGET